MTAKKYDPLAKLGDFTLVLEQANEYLFEFCTSLEFKVDSLRTSNPELAAEVLAKIADIAAIREVIAKKLVD
jgi:hypothetical protein